MGKLPETVEHGCDITLPMIKIDSTIEYALLSVETSSLFKEFVQPAVAQIDYSAINLFRGHEMGNKGAKGTIKITTTI